MRCEAIGTVLAGFLLLASAHPAAACYDHFAGGVPTIGIAETNLDECSPFWKPRVMIYTDRAPARQAPIVAPSKEPGCPTRTFELGVHKVTVFRCQG
ncbi:hypothetical protein [Microvirga massiliensis]|uniref:hypothetical protein n=1 Tax=Microvirga massiliensis TaxID=1033741 RepID=UPI00062BAAEF|nr:hypothetical protein [Microvirga massiliensis]